MGSLKYLLDSTLVIDAINQVPSARAFIAEHQESCFVSPITRAEVLVGANSANTPLFSEILGEFTYLPLDLASVDLAARLRRDHRWKLPDAFQAALAQTHEVQLVTRNTKDFDPEKYGWVLVPYKV